MGPNNCCGPNTNNVVMVARSDSPWGPFVKYRNADGGPILEANERFNAPGHNSIVTDDAGQDSILYHAINRQRPEKGRVLMIDKIEWKNNWPIINGGHGPSFGLQKEGPAIRKD